MDTHRDSYIRKSATLRVCFPVSSFSAYASEKMRVILRNVEAEYIAGGKVDRLCRGSKRFLKPDRENSYRVSGRATMTRANIPTYTGPPAGFVAARKTRSTQMIFGRASRDGRRREELDGDGGKRKNLYSMTAISSTRQLLRRGLRTVFDGCKFGSGSDVNVYSRQRTPIATKCTNMHMCMQFD